MCYSGKCKYENYNGECTIPWLADYPDDAGCVLAAVAEAQAAREKALKELEAPQIRRYK